MCLIVSVEMIGEKDPYDYEKKAERGKKEWVRCVYVYIGREGNQKQNPPPPTS